ncbi:MAG: VOC family protein [Caldilineaceae bacterium]|nr:VOC family protein [Caldilineaceae bacterium]
MTTRTTKRAAGTPTWLDLSTPDLDGAKAFYKQIFGWDYFDTGADFGHYNMAMSQGRNAAGIGPIFPPDSPQPSAWTIYLASDDINADMKRVQELGGQVMVEPMVIGDSGSMAICVDPTGAVFGLWEANNHIGSGVENEHGGMSWFEVNTRDSEAARAFYEALTNTTPNKMEEMDYYVMQRGDDMLYGILQMDAQWEGIPPHWMGYFTVDDTDATVERAVAAGGQVRVPAFDMPYGRMAVLSDPFGATFSIVQPPAA